MDLFLLQPYFLYFYFMYFVLLWTRYIYFLCLDFQFYNPLVAAED